MPIFKIYWFHPSVVIWIVTEAIFFLLRISPADVWDSIYIILNALILLCGKHVNLIRLSCQSWGFFQPYLHRLGPKVAPAAYCLLPILPLDNGKFAKFCRHVGTDRSPLSEYRLTLPSVMKLPPPTVIRSVPGKWKWKWYTWLEWMSEVAWILCWLICRIHAEGVLRLTL